MTLYRDPFFPAIFKKNSPEIRDHDRFLLQILDEWNQNLRGIIEKGISFDDNIDCVRVSVTSHATPGTEFSVTHTLGKVPTDYIVCGQDGAGTVYDGTTANTSTTMYFKSDASSVEFRIILFVF